MIKFNNYLALTCLPDLTASQSTSFIQKYQFWLFLLAAILVRQIPIISVPFTWLASYFHEMSHGLVALLTGGHILQIQLFTNGAGLCTSQGGSRFLISFSGYAGAIVWGSIIYLIATLKRSFARVFCGLIVLLLCCSLLLWVRDVLTFFICVFLLGLFLILLNNKIRSHIQWLVQLIGMVIVLNALLSPLYLIDGRSIGDGASLAQFTFVPEIIWVIIWSSMGVVALYLLGKKS